MASEVRAPVGWFLFGAASWAVNLGFQVAGFQSVTVAILLWAFGAVCFLLGCIDVLRRVQITTLQGKRYQYSRVFDSVAKGMMLFLLVGFLGSATWAAYLSSTFRPRMPLTNVALIETDEKWEQFKYTDISGRTYRNETVLLDGFSFTNCTWEDVTFVYNGTAPTVFDCRWRTTGVFNIRTENPAVKMTVRIIEAFQKATGRPIALDVDVRRRAPWER
jgi:hypothetical protein